MSTRWIEFLESVARNRGDRTRIACHPCSRSLSGNQSFLNHFGSHVTEDGSSETGLSFGRFLPSENPKNTLPNPSRVGYSPNEGVAQNPPNLSFSGNNRLISTQVQNCVLLRGPAYPRELPPFEKPSILVRNRSKIPPPPKKPFSQGPELVLNLPPTSTPPDMCSLRSGKMPIISSSVSRGASPPPPIQQSNFYPYVGPSASHSVGSISDSVIHPTTRSLKRSAREDDVEHFLTGLKKQKPSEEVIVVGNTSKKKPEKLDLTLRL